MSLETAKKYLSIFCDGKDLDRLNDLFCSDLHFIGPMYEVKSAAEYIAALKVGAKEMKFKILNESESTGTTSLLYQLIREGQAPLNVAQAFEMRDGKISKILVIFDAKKKKSPV